MWFLALRFTTTGCGGIGSRREVPEMAFKRQRMSRGKSRRVFRKGTRVNGKNLRARPMRGGWRL